MTKEEKLVVIDSLAYGGRSSSEGDYFYEI